MSKIKFLYFIIVLTTLIIKHIYCVETTVGNKDMIVISQIKNYIEIHQNPKSTLEQKNETTRSILQLVAEKHHIACLFIIDKPYLFSEEIYNKAHCTIDALALENNEISCFVVILKPSSFLHKTRNHAAHFVTSFIDKKETNQELDDIYEEIIKNYIYYTDEIINKIVWYIINVKPLHLECKSFIYSFILERKSFPKNARKMMIEFFEKHAGGYDTSDIIIDNHTIFSKKVCNKSVKFTIKQALKKYDHAFSKVINNNLFSEAERNHVINHIAKSSLKGDVDAVYIVIINHKHFPIHIRNQAANYISRIESKEYRYRAVSAWTTVIKNAQYFSKEAYMQAVNSIADLASKKDKYAIEFIADNNDIFLKNK